MGWERQKVLNSLTEDLAPGVDESANNWWHDNYLEGNLRHQESRTIGSRCSVHLHWPQTKTQGKREPTSGYIDCLWDSGKGLHVFSSEDDPLVAGASTICMQTVGSNAGGWHLQHNCEWRCFPIGDRYMSVPSEADGKPVFCKTFSVCI